MNTIAFPSNHEPLSPGSVPVELEQANSSKSTNELQQFNLSQLPFYDLNSDELLEEFWEEGASREFKTPSYCPKDRGNYVRSYVLSHLRIQAKSTRLKVGWNLEALWDALPFELIISIFEFFHPIDLYHAIRATKGLRSFLLNKKYSTIWEESFLNHPDIPFYPPDVSAPKWASLLFGPATCDTCGIGNCLVDYVLRQRKCDGCMDDYYCDDEELLNEINPIIGEFPDQLENLWSIGMKIYSFNPFLYGVDQDDFHDDFEPDPRYLLKDVTERAHEMRKFLLDIRSGAPDAQSKYETFLSVTGAAVQEHMEQARRCEKWAADIYVKCEATFAASVSAFCEKNERDLLRRGHDSRDVEQAQVMYRWRMDQFKYAEVSDPVFSESRLRRYLPELESILQECITTRVSEERAQRVDARQARISAFYFKAAKEILPREKAPYLPDPQELYAHPFFADYINDPKESVAELDAASAQQELVSFFETLWAARKRRLLAVLLKTGLLPEEATEDSNPDDYLSLATAVFECSHSVFVGWQDAGIHMKCSPSPATTKVGDHLASTLNPSSRSISQSPLPSPTPREQIDDFIRWATQLYMKNSPDMDSAESFRFSDTGYQTLKNLAELVHFDLRFALAKDLDALNKRFICKTCKFTRQAGLHGLHAMTWRECLTHAMKLLNLSLEAPRHDIFAILSDDLTKSVLAVEQPFSPPGEAHWTCKHCRVWFEPVQRAQVAAHVKAVHGITPIEGIHFAYNRPEIYASRPFLFVGLDENSNHRCLRCPSSRRRLWKRRDLFSHIMDKHGIQSRNLIEGVDWIQIKAVEDDSWIEEKMRGTKSY